MGGNDGIKKFASKKQKKDDKILNVRKLFIQRKNLGIFQNRCKNVKIKSLILYKLTNCNCNLQTNENNVMQVKLLHLIFFKNILEFFFIFFFSFHFNNCNTINLLQILCFTASAFLLLIIIQIGAIL